MLNDVKSELVKADADLLCESFNDTVATWLTEWNFPGAKTPQVWRKVPNTRREEAQRAADKGAYEIGLELTDDAINRRYGEDWKRLRLSPYRRILPPSPSRDGTSPTKSPNSSSP